jgi:hypothetical protein
VVVVVNATLLYVHMSPDCPEADVHTVTTVTRVHNTHTYTPETSDAQHAIFSTPLPETLHSIHIGLNTGTNED